MSPETSSGPANGVRLLAEHIAPSMPCVYVAENHEVYKGSIREGLEEGRRAAQEFPNVHFLEKDTVTISGIGFIGATLWTDYRQIALQRKPGSASFRKARRECSPVR